MPCPKPIYEAGLKKNECRVRACNEEGQEYPGQRVPFAYAVPTAGTKGRVIRKQVFGRDKHFTAGLLNFVFEGLGGGADVERLSTKTRALWTKTLDRCDLEAIDIDDCDDYIMEMVDLCNQITYECTGGSFEEWGLRDHVRTELVQAWRHFVRLIWMRDLEWEDLVRCLSDPNCETSINEEYFLPDPSAGTKHVVSNKLLVPLQVWGLLLRSAFGASQ